MYYERLGSDSRSRDEGNLSRVREVFVEIVSARERRVVSSIDIYRVSYVKQLIQ